MFVTYRNNNSIRICLKVNAGAKHTKIAGFMQIGDRFYLKIYINAIPESGNANAALIKLLSKKFSVPQSDISIITGHSSSQKVIEIFCGAKLQDIENSIESIGILPAQSIY